MPLSIEIESKLSSNEEDLLFEIGTSLSGKSILPKDRSAILKIATAWLSKNADLLRSNICGNMKIAELTDDGGNPQQDVLLVAAIADVIADLIVGVSPVTVAVLIAKRGLKTLCAEYKN